jgi:hypothetical protein
VPVNSSGNLSGTVANAVNARTAAVVDFGQGICSPFRFANLVVYFAARDLQHLLRYLRPELVNDVFKREHRIIKRKSAARLSGRASGV